MQKLNVIGEKFITNEGYEVEIIEYKGFNNVTILFNDGTIKKVMMYPLRKGNVKHPYHKNYYDLGYFGEGSYSIVSKCEVCWRSIMGRCYNSNENSKNHSYKDCTVDERWHNFQVFARWYEDNYNPETMQGWHLDKDILVKGNKIYSPDTCAFVPAEINSLFINTSYGRSKTYLGVTYHKRINKYEASIRKNKNGCYLGVFNTPEEAFQVYKEAKEDYIKEVADKWKDLIDPKVYQALYDFKLDLL